MQHSGGLITCILRRTIMENIIWACVLVQREMEYPPLFLSECGTRTHSPVASMKRVFKACGSIV